MINQKIITLDLSHLEDTPYDTLYGLIGYEIYINYDLLFNYKENILTFIKPDDTKEFFEPQ